MPAPFQSAAQAIDTVVAGFRPSAAALLSSSTACRAAAFGRSLPNQSGVSVAADKLLPVNPMARQIAGRRR
ncbi:MAG: hypothetical protein IPL11_13510 [Candidatus Accumulibacter sp.]|nr:hypothetical protein [Accumulibacter sp.]